MDSAEDKITELVLSRFPVNCKIMELANGHFSILKGYLKSFAEQLNSKLQSSNKRYRIKYYSNNETQVEIQLGEDTLWFNLHPNLFRVNESNPVYKYSYMKEDIYRSQCAVINIYNFLSDSLANKRENDFGILVARILINSENHFMMEGKKNLGLLANDIANDVLDEFKLKNLLSHVIYYTLENDLMVQEFNQVPLMSYREVSSNSFSNALDESKRLGFKLKTDGDIDI
jgi:hypothetical protein